jgi:hypothetical protein
MNSKYAVPFGSVWWLGHLFKLSGSLTDLTFTRRSDEKESQLMKNRETVDWKSGAVDWNSLARDTDGTSRWPPAGARQLIGDAERIVAADQLGLAFSHRVSNKNAFSAS